MPDSELAVTLTFAAGEHGSLSTEVEEFSSEISATTDRLDDVDARVREIQRRLGIDPKPESRSQRFRVVREAPPPESWDEVVRRSRAAIGDTPANLDDLLTRKELASIERRFGDGFTARSRLDRYDIMAAVAAGVTAALLDYLVVAVPKESGLTQALKKLVCGFATTGWPGSPRCRTTESPESPSTGSNPKPIVCMTFGHDPLLGWVYGTMDILRGTLTGVSRSGVVNVFESGPPTAESAPCRTRTPGNASRIGCRDARRASASRLDVLCSRSTRHCSARSESVAEISRKMYVDGYDTWHLPTMAVPDPGDRSRAAWLRGNATIAR